MPIPTATTSTPRARSGSTATGSSPRSTRTCRSTGSRSIRSPATSSLAPHSRSGSPPGSTGTRQINQEGGIDVEQFRIESIVDRVNTTGTVFLGLTIGCAQCHDHKYDPIRQREYYRLFAFFNNADEPELEIATPAELARRREVRARIDQFHRELAARYPDLDERERRWESTVTLEFTQAQDADVRWCSTRRGRSGRPSSAGRWSS